MYAWSWGSAPNTGVGFGARVWFGIRPRPPLGPHPTPLGLHPRPPLGLYPRPRWGSPETPFRRGSGAGALSGVWGGDSAGVWGRSPQQHSCGEAAPGFGAEPQPPRPLAPPPMWLRHCRGNGAGMCPDVFSLIFPLLDPSATSNRSNRALHARSIVNKTGIAQEAAWSAPGEFFPTSEFEFEPTFRET